MDARIILAGQPVDLVGAMRQGNAAAIETNALRQNNQLTDLYRQQGAGLLAGDQGAMNALAGVDPGLAMGFKADQQTYAQNTRKMEILDANERRAIEDRAASMTAAERAAAAAEIEDAVKMGMGIPDAATWDQMMGQVAPEMVGQFGNRQALAMRYMSMAEAFKFANPEPVKPQSPQGKFEADRALGLVPADAEFKDGATTVNVGDGNSGSFAKKADELAAARFSEIVTGGQAAQSTMGDLSALAALAPQIGTGKEAELKLVLGPYAEAFGIDIGGLGEGQAYQAIIDRLAPQMKPAGAGATSDFDAKQFLSSLPGLGKTPEGNAIISATLQALQQQKLAAAEIASRAFNNELTWQEADREIAALGNPYDRFNKYKSVAGGGGASALSSEALNYLNTP